MVLEVAESLGIQHVAPANWPMETCSSISLLSPHSPPWGPALCLAQPMQLPGTVWNPETGSSIPQVSFWKAGLWTHSIRGCVPSSPVFAGSSPELALNV